MRQLQRCLWKKWIDYCRKAVIMRKILLLLSYLLNLPFTIAGIFLALVSIPKTISFDPSTLAVIVRVRSLWWTNVFFWLKGARAAPFGQVILLGPHIAKGDLEHELVHIEQWIREPFIHPFLYTLQSFRFGYRHNKYEVEAYTKAHNKYVNAKGEEEFL